MSLWRVWKSDGRYRLVEASTEDQALRRVKHSVRATQVFDVKHPRPSAVAR